MQDESNDSDVSLNRLIQNSIRSFLRFNENSANDINSVSVQHQVVKTLASLNLCQKLIQHLNIVSKNEVLIDINTKDLLALQVDYLIANLLLLLLSTNSQERIVNLTKSREHYTSYIDLLNQLEVIPVAKRSVFAGPSHSLQDPTRRRESKIAQFKLERELQSKLTELQERRNRNRPLRTTLKTAEVDEEDSDEDNDDDEDIARPLIINQLLLYYLIAHSELNSIAAELEILAHSIAAAAAASGRPEGVTNEGNGGERSRQVEDELSWRVEDLGLNDTSALLDSSGRILRPFTILPSTSSSHLSTRLRLQSEVFRSSHRLPTMTIDEYLEIEQERGNILQGGGPSSSRAVDDAREEERGEKEEDNQAGYDREEKEVTKAREWDEYRDEHRRGEGNMHNRG